MARQNTSTLSASTLPKDTNAAVMQVTSTIEKLRNVYSEETEALSNIDNDKFFALQEKKLAAAQKYQNDMGQILARKEEVKNISPSMKKKLKQAYEEFSEISRQNMEALERMQRCTEKLANTLRSAAVRDAHKQSGYSYGEDGAISNVARRKAVSSGLSETV